MTTPVDDARDEYADAMNLELRQSIAARVLEAMDVDQYLIDAVRNAKPPVEPTKPAVEEPTELWSVIAANVPGSHFLEPKQLVLTSGGWLDDEGNGWGDFANFSDVEVLRVGVTDPSSTPLIDNYLEGREDFADLLRREIKALRGSNPLVLERRTYDKVLARITALVGDS